MIRPPFAARVVTGLIVTAIEETRRLPSTAVTLPLTAVSQALQAAMRLQQSMAELAIKGDGALELIFHRSEEQPEWATFDEDEAKDAPQIAIAHPPVRDTPDAEPVDYISSPNHDEATTPQDEPAEQPADDTPVSLGSASAGRFALYSNAPDELVGAGRATPTADPAPSTPGGPAPEIVEFLEYDTLTLAQLRAKIRTVGIDDLQDLADYERSHRGRAPFQTMLDNRITAAANK
ncbi:lipid droplet-associated protein [Williamsia sterculiae]|uniref:Lipid droplet-associated protein n=1 Tax=Williamsia sterculiae TaxID=1344003 RepID=A0A1N7DSZ8_9NOCA|nr:lipid droplet-associated protein [Williamsia sterculiae]SIR78957.1 hypothetical protein SAMN05445060_0883 [Williamsia sterculiae]